MSQLRFDYDTTTIRRYHDAFDYGGSDRNYDSTAIRLRSDYEVSRAPASIRCVPEIFAIRSRSCAKSRRNFDVFGPPNIGGQEGPSKFRPNFINLGHHRTCGKVGDDRPSDLGD